MPCFKHFMPILDDAQRRFLHSLILYSQLKKSRSIYSAYKPRHNGNHQLPYRVSHGAQGIEGSKQQFKVVPSRASVPSTFYFLPFYFT